MNRRDFLNTAGNAALGTVTGAALGSLGIATAAQAQHIHVRSYNKGTHVECWCGYHFTSNHDQPVDPETAREDFLDHDYAAVEIAHGRLRGAGNP